MSTDLDTTTFNTPNGYVTNGFNFIPPNQSNSRAIALQTDGKIVMAGDTIRDFSGVKNLYVAVCRYNTNGTLDTSFGTGGLATCLIQTTPSMGPFFIFTSGLSIQQPSGSIVVCGYVINNTLTSHRIFVVRFDSNGILDTTFGSPNGYIFITPALFNLAYPINSFTDCYAESIQIDTGITPNKIVIGGYATNSAPSIIFFALARLDLNGVLDTSFGINGLVVNNFTGFDEFGYSLAIGSGNYFLAGRQGLHPSLFKKFIVAKFDNVGAPVTGFGTGGVTVIPAFLPSTTQEANSMLVQPDGNIVLAGTSFTTPGVPVQSYALARLDGNTGALDTSFGTGGTVITSVIDLDLTGNSVAIQSDGKIVLGGYYFNTATSLNASFSLARYNVNGSLDLTFGINGNGLILEDIVPGTILPGSMQEIGFSVAIQTDGKILVGGSMGEFSDLGDDVEFILARYFGFPPYPPPVVPICFPAGTPVLTDQGNIPIELIDPNVHTIKKKQIVAITQSFMNEDTIVCIEKHSLGINIPNKRTYISNYHGIIYKNNLIPAKQLVGRLRGIYHVKYNNQILYNVLMEKHYIMNVNNMSVETLNPKNIVAKLYTNQHSPEEKMKLILEINEITKNNKNKNKNNCENYNGYEKITQNFTRRKFSILRYNPLINRLNFYTKKHFVSQNNPYNNTIKNHVSFKKYNPNVKVNTHKFRYGRRIR